MSSLRFITRPFRSYSHIRISSFRCTALPTLPSHVRNYHPATRLSSDDSKKDYLDKDQMNTEADEYSKTGTDNAVGESKDAYDPSVTKPEAGSEKVGKPLDTSPANREASRQNDPDTKHPENSPRDDNSQTGAGSPAKGKKI